MALQARKVSGAFEKRAPGQAPGGAPWVNFAGLSEHPFYYIVYYVVNYRPYLSHFLQNVIFAIPT